MYLSSIRALAFSPRFFVISTDNVAAQLKTIIPILVEHPSFTKNLGEKARERILERYTIAKNINSLEKVYINLKDN